MRIITTTLVLLSSPLAFMGCSEGGEGRSTAPVKMRWEEKRIQKEPCKNGDLYPFDECGKHYLKPQPLEALPRDIPKVSMNARPNDLSKISDLSEKLAGEWIGKPYITGGFDSNRYHWLFRPDQTFVASVFTNTYVKPNSVQFFEMISGTFSEQDGMLLLHVSEKQGPISFVYRCQGGTWEIGSDGLFLKIPIAFHENGTTLTLHNNDDDRWVVNVLVKKGKDVVADSIRGVPTAQDSKGTPTTSDTNERPKCVGYNDPLDPCDRELLRKAPLEGFPKAFPDFKLDTDWTDLKEVSPLSEILAGDWIGAGREDKEDTRIFLRFARDYTFRATGIEHWDSSGTKTGQVEFFSGTFAEQDGMLMMKFADQGQALRFASQFSWPISWLQEDSDASVLKIRVGFHENNELLTVHDCKRLGVRKTLLPNRKSEIFVLAGIFMRK